MEYQQTMQKATEEKETFKAEAHKLKEEEQIVRSRESKPEFIPNGAIIMELFSVQQVSS